MTREEAIWAMQFYKEKLYNGIFNQHIKAFDVAIAALRERETVTNCNGLNEPLTFDDLSQMNGEPVWIVWPDGRIKDCWWIVGSHEWNMMDFDDNLSAKDYGKVWVAYRRKPRWISVEERLPEPFVSVLVYMPGERPLPTVHEGYFVRDANKWYSHFFDRGLDEVTHWMPLPEAPEVDG